MTDIVVLDALGALRGLDAVLAELGSVSVVADLAAAPPCRLLVVAAGEAGARNPRGSTLRIGEARSSDLADSDVAQWPGDPGVLRARARNLLELARLRAALQEMAITDALTGLANRRRIMDVGTLELRRAQRTRAPLCLLMLDVDNVREVNRDHGTAAGDAVIRKVAEVCVAQVRAVDLVGRMDGAEFALVLPMTDGMGGVEVAERVRLAVAAAQVDWEKATLPARVSLGVAQGHANTRDFDTLVAAAGQALTRAKESGRNQVKATLYPAVPEDDNAA